MSDVQFEENLTANDSFLSRKILGDHMMPALARFLIKIGVVKTQKQAKYVMLVCIFVCLTITLYFSWPLLFGNHFFESHNNTPQSQAIINEIGSTLKPRQ